MAAARIRAGTRDRRRAGAVALAGLCVLPLLLFIVSTHGGGAASAAPQNSGFSLPEGPAALALTGNRAPFRLCFAPDGSRVYVAESRESTVAVVDPASGRVLQRLPV